MLAKFFPTSYLAMMMPTSIMPKSSPANPYSDTNFRLAHLRRTMNAVLNLSSTTTRDAELAGAGGEAGDTRGGKKKTGGRRRSTMSKAPTDLQEKRAAALEIEKLVRGMSRQVAAMETQVQDRSLRGQAEDEDELAEVSVTMADVSVARRNTAHDASVARRYQQRTVSLHDAIAMELEEDLVQKGLASNSPHARRAASRRTGPNARFLPLPPPHATTSTPRGTDALAEASAISTTSADEPDTAAQSSTDKHLASSAWGGKPAYKPYSPYRGASMDGGGQTFAFASAPFSGRVLERGASLEELGQMVVLAVNQLSRDPAVQATLANGVEHEEMRAGRVPQNGPLPDMSPPSASSDQGEPATVQARVKRVKRRAAPTIVATQVHVGASPPPSPPAVDATRVVVGDTGASPAALWPRASKGEAAFARAVQQSEGLAPMPDVAAQGGQGQGGRLRNVKQRAVVPPNPRFW